MELSVALVQAPLKWEDPAANRDYFEQRFGELAKDADLIVLPEMFTTGFTMEPGRIPHTEAEATLRWMQHWAGETGAALVGSIIWPKGGTYSNRMFFVEPDGTNHVYDKRHTFTLAGEDLVYERGNANTHVRFRGFNFCLQICYDLRFPVWSRNTSNYDVLIYSANWPDTRVLAWDTLLRARAIENMSYVLGVNRVGDDPNGLRYSGHTAAYDPLGATMAYSEEEEILKFRLNNSTLEENRSKLRFLQDRDLFTPGW